MLESDILRLQLIFPGGLAFKLYPRKIEISKNVPEVDMTETAPSDAPHASINPNSCGAQLIELTRKRTSFSSR